MRRALIALVALLAVLGARPAAGQDPTDAVSSTEGEVAVETAPLPDAGQAFDPGPVPVDPERAPGQQAAPAQSVIGGESVINQDDRTRVTNTTSYPNSAIGRLVFQAFGGQFQCTGFLIDANTVLTSGHCVHEGGTSSDADFFTDHQFTPGQNGATAPFGSCGATELWTTPQWYDDQAEYHDLGIVQLDCSIGDTVGWLGYFAVPGAHALLDEPEHVRGYPGDRPAGTMWTDKARIRASQGLMVFYRNDTFGGQSGSPVFQWGPDCDGPCAMAVHGYGTGHGSPPHRGNNHGPRITEERAALIASVAAENGG